MKLNIKKVIRIVILLIIFKKNSLNSRCAYFFKSNVKTCVNRPVFLQNGIKNELNDY